MFDKAFDDKQKEEAARRKRDPQFIKQ